MNKTARLPALLLLGLLSVSPPAAGDEKQTPAPPAPPPKPTGELTAAEKLFQGGWRLGEFKDDARLGSMHIDGRDFRAEGVHGKHSGYVSIRPQTSPAQIDFTIEDCGGCDFTGKTSAGIYYEEGEIIIFAGPVPGDPRPKKFNKPNELWRMRRLDAAAAADGSP